MGSDVLAPVAYLAVEFPAGRVTGEGFSLVHDLATRGIVTARWQGSYSGLLDQDDADAVAAAIEPGSRGDPGVRERVAAPLMAVIDAMDASRPLPTGTECPMGLIKTGI